jgi:antirestriction protein ArdC
MKRDIYQSITDQIVSELEKGVRPWQKPWSASHMDGRVVLPLRHNGVAYRGVNILTLWMAAIAKGYSAPIWMTFKQAIDLGGCVRQGEKGCLTVYADKITRTETDSASGAEPDREIHYMKGYTVFNVEQIDGLPERYHTKPAPRLEPLPRIAHAEAFFASTAADIRHGGNSAYYSAGSDHVQMPGLRLSTQDQHTRQFTTPLVRSAPSCLPIGKNIGIISSAIFFGSLLSCSLSRAQTQSLVSGFRRTEIRSNQTRTAGGRD